MRNSLQNGIQLYHFLLEHKTEMAPHHNTKFYDLKTILQEDKHFDNITCSHFHLLQKQTVPLYDKFQYQVGASSYTFSGNQENFTFYKEC